MTRLVACLFLALFYPSAFSKSEEPSHFLMHDFPGGSKVVFRTGGDGLQGIFYVYDFGRAVLIDPRHAYFIGQPDGSRETTLELSQISHVTTSFWKMKGASRLAYAIMGGEILIIKENGEHRRLSLLPAGTTSYSKMSVLDCHVFNQKGKEYLYIVYNVGSREDATAILIDEDVRYAKKEVSIVDANMREKILLDLNVALPGTPEPLFPPDALYTNQALAQHYLKQGSRPQAEYVSLAFAQGITAQYRPLKDVTVLDNEGKQVGAIDFIKSFTTNLTEKFKLHPRSATHVNHDGIRRITQALAGYEITSVAYLGHPGTGKTTDVNIMISEAANGRGPEFLREYTFIKIEPGSLDGQKWRGSTEIKIAALKALARQNKIIFVMDEVHRLKGTGAHSEKHHDVTEDLKEEMAEGVLKLIGISTEQEYYSAGFSKPFLERLHVVEKDEPAGDALINLLRAWIVSRNLPEPSREFLLEAERIADRFSGVGAQPRKTTKLIDAVFSRLKLDGRESETPTIPFLHEVARETIGFDAALIDPKLARHRLEQMTKVIDGRIIGQAKARALFERASIRAFSGLSAELGPRLKILLAGPEGQGKTSIAKAYAEGMGLPYVIIDMSQCRYGLPPGAGPLSQAAQAMARNPFTVLIFDELEKCAIEEQEKLLQALENGKTLVQMQTKTGLVSELIDFRNASVVFTTNAGAETIQNQSRSIGFVQMSTATLARELLNGGRISRYVLDRVPDIAIIESLNKREFRAAVELHLAALLQRYSHRGHNVSFAHQEDYLDFAASIWRPGISNRRISEILRPIEDYLAQETLLSEGLPKDQLHLSFQNGILSLTGAISVYSCEDLLESI